MIKKIDEMFSHKEYNKERMTKMEFSDYEVSHIYRMLYDENRREPKRLPKLEKLIGKFEEEMKKRKLPIIRNEVIMKEDDFR